MVRDLLRRRLSPEAYQSVRVCWWQSHFYWPHRFASTFIRRHPQVEGYSSHQQSQLVRLLRGINVYAPTEMCRVMTKHGSDKGQGWHNYTTIYSVLFKELRDRRLRILELGLGTNNPLFAFNMGTDARPGASLRGWRELFPHASVFGADIDRAILFKEDRIETFYCDQTSIAAIRGLWSQTALQGGMDIIIDDGLHTFEANSLFLDQSLGQLSPGGIYVIEDIFRETIVAWRSRLMTLYARHFPNHESVMVELPNALNSANNNLLIIKRHK